MALVNSDLFLVQDASTKTNYKVTFQTLADQIDTDVNLDGRVAVAGDDMTGNLTLGTDKIVLNASDGSAAFAVDRIAFASTGVITTWRKSNNGPDILQYWKSNVGAGNRTQVSFSADGSADFNGDITANAFVGDGSALTNLPVEPGLWVESGNDLSPITANQNLTSITDITASGDVSAVGGSFSGNISAVDGTYSGDISGANAVFTGTLEADSIDGGTYS